MSKLLIINSTCNQGSTGKISEQVGLMMKQRGWDVYLAHGARHVTPSSLLTIPFSSVKEEYMHALKSFLFDADGLGSVIATKRLVKRIKEIAPDLIHLHNIHGYYINYPILFDFLKNYNHPVVWTLHDCWSFTGHCTHFEYNNCFKWRTSCYDCKFKQVYPSSLLFERSKRNYEMKKKYFTSLNNLTLVPVSKWLDNYLKESFFKNKTIQVIHNGINVSLFRPNNLLHENGEYEILGVANNWKMRKGLPDFIILRKNLPPYYHITLIGLSKDEIKSLPIGIKGLERTNNIEELVCYYNRADVLVNPTYEDNFPTINLEALACGTPVITYRTGGSPEAIDEKTGIVVEQGYIDTLAESIKKVCNDKNKYEQRKLCRQRAERLFNQADSYKAYIDLYKSLLGKI